MIMDSSASGIKTAKTKNKKRTLEDLQRINLA